MKVRNAKRRILSADNTIEDEDNIANFIETPACLSPRLKNNIYKP
jgi:hypothetical protein